MTTEKSAASRKRIASFKKRLAYQKASELIQEYGLKEGLRRLKKSHPEIAEYLEYFTEKDTVVEKH